MTAPKPGEAGTKEKRRLTAEAQRARRKTRKKTNSPPSPRGAEKKKQSQNLRARSKQRAPRSAARSRESSASFGKNATWPVLTAVAQMGSFVGGVWKLTENVELVPAVTVPTSRPDAEKGAGVVAKPNDTVPSPWTNSRVR